MLAIVNNAGIQCLKLFFTDVDIDAFAHSTRLELNLKLVGSGFHPRSCDDCSLAGYLHSSRCSASRQHVSSELSNEKVTYQLYNTLLPVITSCFP